MSRSGEIRVVCDSCEGEHFFCADDFEGSTIESRLDEIEWTEDGTGKARQDLCVTCAEEIENGIRCDRCWARLDPHTICGDCYGGTEMDPAVRSVY